MNATDDWILSGGIETDKRYLIRGSVLNAMGLVLRNISPVLVFVLARIFPKDVFGVFVSVTLFTLTASHLLVMGFDKGLLWYIPRNQEQSRPLHTGLVAVTRTTHLVAFAAWALAALYLFSGGQEQIASLSPVSPWFVTVCLFSLVPYMALHGLSAALEGRRLPQYKLLVNQFLSTTLGPILAIGLHFAGWDEISLALGFTSANLLGAMVLVGVVNRRFAGIRWTDRERIDRELWSYSWPLGLSQAVAGILLRVDLWMILLLLGPEDAAVYAIMVTLSNGLKAVRQNFDPLIVPIVSSMKQQRRSTDLKEVFTYAVNMVTGIQMLVAVTVLFFPVYILSIAGESYTVQPQALSILMVGNLINGLLALNGQVILGLGKSRPIFLLNAATLVLNLSLNFLLIKRLGISGAATATALAYLAQCSVLVAYQKRLSGHHLYKPHLGINALLVAAFAIATFGYQQAIIELSLLHKIAAYAACLLLLALLFLLKRKTFSLGEA